MAIKASLHNRDGKSHVLLIGITPDNVARMADDKPFVVTLGAMRELQLPPVEILIFLEESDRALTDRLKAYGWDYGDEAESQLQPRN